MNRSPRTTRNPRQRPLRFPAFNGQVELWNGLTEGQRLECRQVLGQMLLAVARHVQDAIDGHHGSRNQETEDFTHD